MLLNPDFRDILCALRDEQTDFLLVGSYAVAVYGRARATEDLDIWVRPSEANSKKVMQALLRFGAPTSMLTAEDFNKEDSFSKWVILLGESTCSPQSMA